MTGDLDLLSLTDTQLERLYTERVEPIFQTQERERATAMRSFQQRLILVIAGAIGIAAVSWFIWHDAIQALVFGGVACAFGYWFAYAPLSAVATATKEKALTAIAQAIGCTYTLSGFERDGLQHFEELRLLPSCDRSDYQDCFRGAYKGCGFAFYDGHLERRVQTKNGSRWETVFRGQLISIAFPKKFLSTTVVRRDAGIFNTVARWFSSMQRVGLGDSRLEKAFEVYSTDQVEARYLIHPVFMERLLALEAAFKGERLRCAFVDGLLLVAVEGGDKFEIGSMFAKLADIGRVQAIVADITEVMRLVDAVLTAEQSPLPSP